MSRPYRQSIMMRPVKSPSLKNQEALDLEYQREQERLAALAARKQQLEEERLKAIHPTRETKAEISEKLRAEMERQLREKEEMKRRVAEAERRIAELAEQQVQYSRVHERDSEEVRRQHQRYFMEENKRLMEYRAELKRQQAAMEKAAPEGDFFSRWGRSAR